MWASYVAVQHKVAKLLILNNKKAIMGKSL